MTETTGYWYGLGMPYRPSPAPGYCELCWREADELACVTISPPGHRTVYGQAVRTTSRIVFVCKRHRGEDAQGPPISAPNDTMAPGTSKRRPQTERLFDDGSLVRGGPS